MAKTTINARSLARWRRNPAKFIEECLRNPETGLPFVLLPAEKAFLRHAFKRDRRGKLVFAEQVYSCPKKSGKSAFNAMYTLTNVLVFGGKFAEGFVIANDLEQARGRVFEAIRRIVAASPLLRREAKVVQNKISFPATGATITAIASDYQGAAGANPSLSSFDEAWAYTSERSHRLWDEMVPSPARTISARLVTTYAGFSGESALLESLYKRGLAQPLIGPDLYAGDGLLMYWSHAPVAPWQDQAWLDQMRRSLRPNQYLRMIENRFTATSESFIDMDEWDACCLGHPVPADPGLAVFAGVDASYNHDSTGIVAAAWDRGTKRVRLVHHRIFTPSPKSPIDFERDVEAAILDLKHRFRLKEVRYDPYQMQASAQRLRQQGVNMVEFPQSVGNLTNSSQNLLELIKGGNLLAYPDADLRLAMQRAVAVENPRGWRIAKEKSSHKIDVVVALAMAALAAVQKGQLGRMRMGTAMMTGTGPSIVTWHDEPRTHSRIRWATIKVDGDGNEVKPLRRRGLL